MQPQRLQLVVLDSAMVRRINDEQLAVDGLSHAELDSKIVDKDKIAGLAALSDFDYDRKREAAAKELGIRVKTLDAHVQSVLRKDTPVDTKAAQGNSISLFEPEAWPEPVDGAQLIADVMKAIRRHVVISGEQALATALWVIHTHLLDCFTISPRLAITSPEPGCGKTTLLDILAKLSWRSLLAVNISVSSVFRTVASYSPTLLIDEADTFLPDNDDLRGVLNSGHRRGGKVIRTVGDDHEPREFVTYSACAIAMIGGLSPTLDSRSISIAMARAKADEVHERFRFDRTPELDILARKARRWAIDNEPRVKEADPETGDLYNRAADNWRTLVAVADVAGGDIGRRARQAAKALIGGEKQTYRVLLLEHIRSIMAGNPEQAELSSQVLTTALAAIDSAPWAEWSRGKPITPKALASLLAPLRIAPASDGKRRGYSVDQFVDAFERYLPPQGGGSLPQCANVSTSPSNKNFLPVSMRQSEKGFDGSAIATNIDETGVTDTLTDANCRSADLANGLDPDSWSFNLECEEGPR
jgi:putative DNA primase/helicase